MPLVAVVVVGIGGDSRVVAGKPGELSRLAGWPPQICLKLGTLQESTVLLYHEPLAYRLQTFLPQHSRYSANTGSRLAS